jgi:uncharacterized protein (DUF1800 family)
MRTGLDSLGGMQAKNDEVTATRPDASAAPASPVACTLAAATLALAACGGGGSAGGGSSTSSAQSGAAAPATPAEAARFLHQASIAATDTDMAAVQAQGYGPWLDNQFATVPAQTNYDWLLAQGFDVVANQYSQGGVDAAVWRSLISAPNPVMQRLAMFWLEYFVVSLGGLPIAWPQFVAAAYLDLLTRMAVANFRDLLKAVTLSAAMGEYLSLRGSVKADPASNRHPDENYAREVMQLFTLGLYQLNPDGSQVLVNGLPVPTYTQDDVTGLAAALTGWEFAAASTTPDYARLPMIQIASRHATYAASFLGVTVPAGTDGAAALEIVLDTLFHHPNLAPFLARQLIQRLVTSNPSAGYVGRVAAAFVNDGFGVRGNLAAVVKTALLDSEARSSGASGAGRVREPMLRFAQWARTFKASSSAGAWSIGSTSDAASQLGQSPLRAPTVFNFFSPDYAPPGSNLAGQGHVAPELQLLDESSVAGYLNFMQRVIGSGIGDVSADYSSELAAAGDANALVQRVQLLLAAAQLDTATLNQIVAAVASIDASTAAGQSARVHAAVLLVMASPAYQVLK